MKGPPSNLTGSSGPPPFKRWGTPLGFSLAETLLSVVLVGGLVVVALNTVGAAATGLHKTGDWGRGYLLALDLMTEILEQPYADPEDPSGFGREGSESGGSRAGYDDVDDYHGWEASPPESKSGSAMPDLDGWTRGAVVHYVDPDDLNKVVGSDLGVKRITVTVKDHDAVVARLVAVRTGSPEGSLVGLSIRVPTIY